MLAEPALFALAGLGLEVVYTALASRATVPLDRRRHLMGYSSVWYLPLYAMLPVFLDLAGSWLFAWPWPLRGLFYAGVAGVAEFASMGVLHLLHGESPSEASYRQSRWSVHGLTRLDHGPVYFAGGLAFEWLFRALR